MEGRVDSADMKPVAAALLLVASIAATLAAFEAAARWAMRGDPGALFAAASVEPDPIRGGRHRPGASGAYGHGSWVINPAGAPRRRTRARAGRRRPASGDQRAVADGPVNG